MSGADGIKICPTCGRINSAANAGCRECGASLLDIPARGGSGLGSGKASRPSHSDPGGGRRAGPRWYDAELYPPAVRGGATGTAEPGGPHRYTRKRRSVTPLIVGVALIITGVVVIASIYAINAKPRTEQLASGDTWAFSPTTLTGVTAVVKWSGGTPQTRIYMVFGKPDCFVPTGVIANGSGPNGSFRASLDPSTTYNLYACASGSPVAMNFTVSLLGGLTLAEIVAGFMVGIGFGLLAMGLRGRAVIVHAKRGTGREPPDT